MGYSGTLIRLSNMGCCAGVAIESDDVTIDLNGHSLATGKVFHRQQRWFSVIEVGSKAIALHVQDVVNPRSTPQSVAS